MRNETRSVWRWWGMLMVGVGVVILLDFSPIFKPLRWVAEVVLKPVRLTAVGLGDSGRSMVAAVGSVRSSYRRVADLERRVAELAVTAAQVEGVMAENEALRKLAAAKPRQSRTVVPALVVGKGELWLVDVGTGSGIDGGEAVVTAEGALIGVVADVGAYVSKVRLVTSPTIALGVETQAGTAGELKGGGETVEFGGVLQENRLSVGDRVVTTGEEGMVPAGLVIGTVEKVEVIPSAVYKRAEVQPLFDAATRSVFIID